MGFILIWIFVSALDNEVYSGSARFNTEQACELAKTDIKNSTIRKFVILKCFDEGTLVEKGNGKLAEKMNIGGFYDYK